MEPTPLLNPQTQLAGLTPLPCLHRLPHLNATSSLYPMRCVHSSARPRSARSLTSTYTTPLMRSSTSTPGGPGEPQIIIKRRVGGRVSCVDEGCGRGEGEVHATPRVLLVTIRHSYHIPTTKGCAFSLKPNRWPCWARCHTKRVGAPPPPRGYLGPSPNLSSCAWLTCALKVLLAGLVARHVVHRVVALGAEHLGTQRRGARGAGPLAQPHMQRSLPAKAQPAIARNTTTLLRRNCGDNKDSIEVVPHSAHYATSKEHVTTP